VNGSIFQRDIQAEVRLCRESGKCKIRERFLGTGLLFKKIIIVYDKNVIIERVK
jgi:hypothetical protein